MEKYVYSYKDKIFEKAKSQVQQKAAGMAYAAKIGELDTEELIGAAKEMYDAMSKDQLRDFARTKHDNLPFRK